MTAEIETLAVRYLEESAKAGGFPEFTRDEVSQIRGYVQARFADQPRVLYAYDRINMEFTRGHRCGVCGRTEAQNLAINYDCTHEC